MNDLTALMRLEDMRALSRAPDQSFAQIISYLDGDDTSALRMLSAENFQERVRGAAYLTMAMPAYQLA